MDSGTGGSTDQNGYFEVIPRNLLSAWTWTEELSTGGSEATANGQQEVWQLVIKAGQHTPWIYVVGGGGGPSVGIYHC